MNESFYLFLPSNVKDNTLKNTIGNYITYLPTTLKLNGEWEVGLSEILLTKTWFNIPNNEIIKIFMEEGAPTYSKILEEGIYKNLEQLIFEINKNLNDIINYYHYQISTEKGITSPQFYLTENKSHMILKPGYINGKIVLPLLSNNLYSILGFNIEENLYDLHKEITIGAQKYKGGKKSKSVPDLKNIINVIYVYTDIIKSSIVGDTFTRILRAISVPNKEYGETIQIMYENPHFFKIDRNEIQSIEIDIKDDTGQTLKFDGGRVVTVLHFRKNE
ncbi:MAG: hypothetical protein QM535_17595 [Limnohabitans sp.]|nr:hypothetical protein [Limnohabitans sp.]